MVRILYRTRQFWNVLAARPMDVEATQEVEAMLSKRELDLFLRMQSSEQRHSYQVYRTLTQQGIQDQDLLKAALLHDIGKTRHPLSLLDRVLIVLGRSLFTGKVKEWGRKPSTGWRRIFTVAEQHPAWGAEMADGAGSSRKTVELIRRHQDDPVTAAVDEGERLLSYLQSADDSL